MDYSDESCYVTRADYIRESYRYNDLSDDKIVSWHLYNSGGYVTGSDYNYFYTGYADIICTLNTRTGVFRVSGWGEMPDSINWPLWNDYYRDFIKTVIIEDGITGIGRNNFSYCYNLTDIVIPESITYIGFYAFDYTNLKNIYYTGSAQQWDNICVDSGNENIRTANIHFNQGSYQTSSDYDGNATYSGSCGDAAEWKLTYEYSDEGSGYVLNVSGCGEMKTDWFMLSKLRNYYISKLVISEDITAIDDYAFYGLNIYNLVLPNTLKKNRRLCLLPFGHFG